MEEESQVDEVAGGDGRRMVEVVEGLLSFQKNVGVDCEFESAKEGKEVLEKIQAAEFLLVGGTLQEQCPPTVTALCDITEGCFLPSPPPP